MKTNLLVFCVLGTVWMGSVLGRGDDVSAATHQQSKTYSGIIASLDAKEKTMTVKGLVFEKTFVAGDGCKVINGDGKDGALDSLHPGQKVKLDYRDARGVLVANRIVEEKMFYSGSVESLDPEKRVLRVKGGAFGRTFRLPADCRVVLKDEKAGGLNDVKVGHTVTVVYETPNGAPVARQVEQTSATFVGTLDAIDASTRMVKAKHLVGEKKFNLADNCRILLDGKANASLSDLRLGQRLAFSYDDVDGVSIVTRIGPASGATAGETALSGKAPERAQK